MLSIKNQEIEKKEKRHIQIRIVRPILFELLTEYILFDRKDKKKKKSKKYTGGRSNKSKKKKSEADSDEILFSLSFIAFINLRNKDM